MVEIGSNWVCPRCRECIVITDEGISHASNINGPHFQRYSLEDLNAIKEFESKQINRMFYGSEEI